MVPMPMAELFFESLLELEEQSLLKEGSLFYAQKKEAAVLIPEALSALGVLKVIATYSEPPEEEGAENPPEQGEEKYLQVMHSIQQEYGESLCRDDDSLRELTKDAERRWNNAFAQAFLKVDRDWDSEFPDAALDYALEMLPSHMIRGNMDVQAAAILSHSGFVRGRLFLLGRENATRRHIKDCEHLFNIIPETRGRSKKKRDRKTIMKECYETLGKQLDMDEDENGPEDNRVKGVEVGRAHYDIGFSLADKKCWEAAIAHWEKSQELLVSSIGMVEIVAAILFNVGVVYAEMSDYERSLGSLKQCLRIRGALHGEDHLLYAQTIQKIGDVFLMMSDYHEAMESYNWALDVMHIEPSLHRVDIGDIQENLGNIHYSKGEINEALLCFQEALKSKQADLGEEHPELATIYHHIGNCLADQDNRFEAIDHFEQAIQLKEIDPDGGPDRDADVLTIEGVLSSISGRQEEGLECYEKALFILVRTCVCPALGDSALLIH
jgi:tetratricopeptide (TPR) repeat protein